MNRRAFLFGAAGATLAACTRGHAISVPTLRGDLASGKLGPAELWSSFDLPNDPRARELSGICWDPKENVLWAVQDENPSIVPLHPDRDLKSWTFGEAIPVDVKGDLDLEGLVLLDDGFIVCSEIGPRVIEVDRKGHFRREIKLPSRFADARTNKSLESLTSSPSGRYLFTTTENALTRDGEKPTTTAGSRVRIVRMGRGPAGTSYETVVSEHVYVTDPVPYETGDSGVADLAACGDDRLLVLERGWTPAQGNTVRIYETRLEPRASCMNVEQLSTDSPTLTKTLCVDLSKIETSGLPETKQPQASPLLDNFEGMAIGPRLRDGRVALFLVSDDNNHANQFARVVTLAI